MRLSIVIVNWNSVGYLKPCINSIFAATTMRDFEVVVIDSGSFDGCGQMLSESFPQVRFIQAESNLGFGAANNRAFEVAIGEYVLFLNPDTLVEANAIDKMCQALAALPNAGVLGCKLLNSDGTLQVSCVQVIPTILNQVLGADILMRRMPRSRLWGLAALNEQQHQIREVEAVSGACMMIRRTVFEEIGKFSKDYFMYVEDVDLAYKARRAGYRNYFIADAVVVHHGGGSSGQISAFAAVMMREAIWRFLRKNRGSVYAGAYRLSMCVSSVLRLALLAILSLVVREAKGSRQKWIAILEWTLRRDAFVRTYYSDALPSGSTRGT